MTTFRYQIYYLWSGPSHSDPFANPKTDVEIDEALVLFPKDLHSCLSGMDAIVRIYDRDVANHKISIEVHTVISRGELESYMVPLMRSFRLLGNLIGETAT